MRIKTLLFAIILLCFNSGISFASDSPASSQPAVDEKTAGPVDPNELLRLFFSACEKLYQGVDRREVARLFREVTARTPEASDQEWVIKQGRTAGELAGHLDQMSAEDEAFQAPANLDQLTEHQRIEYYVFRLRDVATRAFSVPGRCQVMLHPWEPGVEAAVALRKIGKPAIPALMALLEDRRPTRSVEAPMNGGHVLRYCDVAAQIMEAIAGRRFVEQHGRGSHLANAGPADQEQIRERIHTWWRENKEKAEAQWLREALAETPIRSSSFNIKNAERLIELEGEGAIVFFREKLVAEPDDPWSVALLYRAGGNKVLDDIRPKMSHPHPGVRAAAYRALLEAGESDVVDRVIAELHRQLEEDAKPEKITPRSGFYDLRTWLALLVRMGGDKGVRAAADLILHDDPEVASDAIVMFQLAIRGEHAVSPEHQRMVLPNMASVLDRPKVGRHAAYWIIMTFDLPIEWRSEQAGPNDQTVVKKVKAWWAEQTKNPAHDKPAR